MTVRTLVRLLVCVGCAMTVVLCLRALGYGGSVTDPLVGAFTSGLLAWLWPFSR